MYYDPLRWSIASNTLFAPIRIRGVLGRVIISAFEAQNELNVGNDCRLRLYPPLYFEVCCAAFFFKEQQICSNIL